MPFGGFGIGEIILILVVLLLLFGAQRLPELGSSLGKGIREFKSSVNELESGLDGSPERRDRELEAGRTQSRERADAASEEPAAERTPNEEKPRS